jgi:DNA (cytosine-5)-methyltransferase 1
MAAYYNEFDPYAAQWLRNLIQKGLIAGGEVDERSIEEVSPDDLRGFTQAHFFAGIGGWSLAARLAGWPDERPLWTGSCPCQPFSTAGQRKGESDERHLWPAFHSLIDQLRPPAVCGEQVSSRLGYRWLSGVRADLEASGYAVGAIDLCAASVGAPHIRQRLWWMAYPGRSSHEFGSGLGETSRAFGKDEAQEVQRERSRFDARSSGSSSGMGDASDARLSLPERDSLLRAGREFEGGAATESSASSSHWDGIWIDCADGKARRIEPSIEPLASGISNRVGRLRAYGNAIVPQVGAEIIRAMMEVRP